MLGDSTITRRRTGWPDAVAVEVEAERLGLAFAQRERGGALGGILEPDELGQLQCSVGGADVAQHVLAQVADGERFGLQFVDAPHLKKES